MALAVLHAACGLADLRARHAPLFKTLGLSWGHLGALLESPWGHLRVPWGLLGPSWELLEPSWGIFGAYLEASWGLLGVPWGDLGAILKRTARSAEFADIRAHFALAHAHAPARSLFGVRRVDRCAPLRSCRCAPPRCWQLSLEASGFLKLRPPPGTSTWGTSGSPHGQVGPPRVHSPWV